MSLPRAHGLLAGEIVSPVEEPQRVYCPAGCEDGQPRIEGPVTLYVDAAMSRPGAHWLRDGTLSAAGTRTPRPTRKPDIDNILKLGADALSGRAFGDDALIVKAHCTKRWAHRHAQPYVAVEIAAVQVPA